MDNYEKETLQSDYTLVDPNDPAVRLHAASTFSSIGLSIFEILLVGTALQSLIVLLMQKFSPSLFQSEIGMWIYTFVPLYVLAMPIGIKMLQRIDAYPPERKTLSVPQLLAAFLVCLFLMYAGNLIGVYLTTFLNGGNTVNPLDGIIANNSVLLRILIPVVIGPFMEELIFRKLLIDRMIIYGEKLAIVTSALLFGLFHGNLSQFCYAVPLGLAWGYIYVKSGSIKYSFSLHMLVNLLGSFIAPALLEHVDLETLQTISMETDPERMMSLLTPGVLAYISYVMFMLIASFAGFIILLRMRKRLQFEPAVLELPKEGRFRTVWMNRGMFAVLFGCIALMIYSQIVMANL